MSRIEETHNEVIECLDKISHSLESMTHHVKVFGGLLTMIGRLHYYSQQIKLLERKRFWLGLTYMEEKRINLIREQRAKVYWDYE